MPMIEPTSNCHESMPARFAAAHCATCDSTHGLTLVDGTFRCRDSATCRMFREETDRARRAEARLMEQLRLEAL